LDTGNLKLIIAGTLKCELLQIALIANALIPDLTLINGKIVTSDTAQIYVKALAIKAGRIIATSTKETI